MSWHCLSILVQFWGLLKSVYVPSSGTAFSEKELLGICKHFGSILGGFEVRVYVPSSGTAFSEKELLGICKHFGSILGGFEVSLRALFRNSFFRKGIVGNM
ncbi:hypothetical protein ACE6H2_018356 [Prunus campanulata]